MGAQSWSSSFLQKSFMRQKMHCLHSGLYFQIQFLQLSLSGLICWASHLCGSSPDLQAWPLSSCLAPPSTPPCSGKQLPALSYAQRFCNDDSERDLTASLKTSSTCLSWPFLTAPITTYHPARCSSFCIRSFASCSLQSHRTLLFPIPHHVGARWVLVFTKMIWNSAPKP